MQKILVTGAGGFVGSRLVSYYAERYQVIAVSHADCELTNIHAAEALIARHKPQVVVHLAAVSDTKACEENPEKSNRVNVLAAGNVAMACAGHGAKMVFASSDQVYNGCAETAPHIERERLFPASEYGRQKMAAERLVLALAPDTVCLRLTWMYDTHTAPNEKANFYSRYLSRLQTEETLSYPVYDARGLTDVWEVVRNMEAAWSLPGGIYNFGSPATGSVCEVACALAAAEQPPCSVQPDLSAFAEQPRDLRMDTEKLAAFGITFSDTAAHLLALRAAERKKQK